MHSLLNTYVELYHYDGKDRHHHHREAACNQREYLQLKDILQQDETAA
jgi:hypothetical protein